MGVRCETREEQGDTGAVAQVAGRMELPSAKLGDYEWDRWDRNRRQGWPAGNRAG